MLLCLAACATPTAPSPAPAAPAAAPRAPTGELLWGKRLDFGFNHPLATTDPRGNVLVACVAGGRVDLGAGPIDIGPRGLLLAKYDPGGELLWSRVVGRGQTALFGVVANDAGRIVVAAGSGATVDFGGGTLGEAGSANVFVAAYDENGAHVYSRAFSTNRSQVEATGVALDASGNVALSGHVHGPIDFGGGVLQPHGSSDAFVLRLDAEGRHAQSRVFGTTSAEAAHGVTFDAAGNVVLLGLFSSALDFGLGPVTAESVGDAFVVKLTPGLQPVYAVRIDHPGYDEPRAVAVDGRGNTAVTIAMKADEGNLYDDVVVALDAAGRERWRATVARTPSPSWWGALAFDAEGNLLLTGAVGSHGSKTAEVVKLAADGGVLYRRSVRGPLEPRALGTDARGEAILLGEAAFGEVVFGKRDVPLSSGSTVLMKLAP